MTCYRCGWPIHVIDDVWLYETHRLVYSWCTHLPNERHSDTQISPDYSMSKGISILCNSCWLDLQTPEARWPYYERWIQKNIKDLPPIKQFAIEDNNKEDHTYDEELILRVGNPVLALTHPNTLGYVDNINNFSVTVAFMPLQRYGRHTIAKSDFDCYFTRTGLDQRLYEQVSHYNWSERAQRGLLQD